MNGFESTMYLVERSPESRHGRKKVDGPYRHHEGGGIVRGWVLDVDPHDNEADANCDKEEDRHSPEGQYE